MACEERGRGPAPLKLVVFGGTGLTGKEVVKQALEKGYSVTSVVRSPEKAEIRYDAHFQGCTHPIIVYLQQDMAVVDVVPSTSMSRNIQFKQLLGLSLRSP